MLKQFDCIRIDGDRAAVSRDPVAAEVPLVIYINGRHFSTAMISPSDKEEYVTGHLFSEGIIRSLDEIESLEVESFEVESWRAHIILKNPIRAITSRRTIVSGCGGSSSFLDRKRLGRIESDASFEPQHVLMAVKSFSDSEVHRATGGIHCAGIFDGGAPVCVFEDIGRHSAMDKAIGYCLRNGLDMKSAFAACTGRISSDMALKCSTSGLPMIASREAVTSLAIEIAEKSGLCVVGFARGKRITVFTHTKRIAIPGRPNPEKAEDPQKRG